MLPAGNLTFAPVLIPLLPPFPPGDWNQDHVSRDPTTGQDAVFSRLPRSILPAVETIWHPTRIDHLELTRIGRFKQNVILATHPVLFDVPVVVKFAEFPWQIPLFEAETAAYQWVDGRHIAPAFLGHLTEDGGRRVIGFVLQAVVGGGRGARTAAGPKDLAACRRVLARLHALGIKHGDVNKYNFLLASSNNSLDDGGGGDGDGGEAVLIDLESAVRCDDGAQLELEYRSWEQSLGDPSENGRAGLVV